VTREREVHDVWGGRHRGRVESEAGGRNAFKTSREKWRAGHLRLMKVTGEGDSFFGLTETCFGSSRERKIDRQD